jgi:hypothetical protein
LTTTALHERSVTIIETVGALGILVARDRLPGGSLKGVVYARICMQTIGARCFRQIDFVEQDGFWIASASEEDALLLEPSRRAFEARPLTIRQYVTLIDLIVDFQAEAIVRVVADIFQDSPRFLTDDGGISADASYVSGLPYFVKTGFLVPKGRSQRSRKPG